MPRSPRHPHLSAESHRAAGEVPRRAPALGVVALLCCAFGCHRDPAPVAAPVLGPPVFDFVEGAATAGLAFRHASGDPVSKKYLIDTIGSGVVIADFNNDGHLDVYLIHGGDWGGRLDVHATNRLFFGDGKGHFRAGAETDPCCEQRMSFGAVAADYDRDGFVDLFVCNHGGNRLLHNRGDGTFEDVTEKAGVAGGRWSVSAAFGDVDGDGLLDLYVANYFEFGSQESRAKTGCDWAGIKVSCGPKGMKAEHGQLFRNRGDGTFEDVTQKSGLMDEPPRYALAVMMTDLDQDGDIDLYIANDSHANAFWRNDGHGRFEDVGLETGIALSGEGHAQAGMGIAIEDIDGDARDDLVVTNFARDYNVLYHQNPDATFDDWSSRVGIAEATYRDLGFGVLAADFDGDGWPDLFFANGHVYPEVDRARVDTTYAQLNQVFHNERGVRFARATDHAGTGFTTAHVSRGAAIGDLDEDGREDIVVNVLDGAPLLLWNHTRQLGHHIAVRVVGRPGVCDRNAIGATVTVRAGGRTHRREVRAGGSFASCSLGDLWFGLGDVRAVESIVVKFRDGVVVEHKDVPLDAVTLVEHP